MTTEGTLEVMPEGWDFVRQTPGQPDERDAYVSYAQIQRFGLKAGDEIRGEVRPPRVAEGERYFGLVKIEHINGQGVG